MTHTAYSKGFTLLEVMIALVIFSIGLLGLAGLQGISVQNNQVAFSRTVANQLAYDMADRIRNNKAGDYTVSIPGSATSCITSSADCNANALALYDLYDWNRTLNDAKNNLSNVVGTVTRNGSVYTITIAWDEKNLGLAKSSYDCTTTPPTPAGLECVKLEVMP